MGDDAPTARLVRRGEAAAVVAVSVGGVLGSLGRYALGEALPHRPAQFPWSTVLINLTGCALIGVLMVVLTERTTPNPLVRPLLGVGVLGGYTTYSTFAVDVVRLVDEHRAAEAAGYLVLTVVGAVAAVTLAVGLTRRAPRTGSAEHRPDPMTVLLVALGAAVGAPLRFVTDRRLQEWRGSSFPWGTLTVNLVASAVLGALAGAGSHLDPDVTALIGTGFCGALSTYSTFSYETLRLYEAGTPARAAANVAVTLAAGIGVAALGWWAGAALS